MIGIDHARNVRDYCQLAWKDRKRNRCCNGSNKRVLVVRSHRSPTGPHAYDVILDWMEANVPEVRGHFELRGLPCFVRDWSRYALHVPWLQDPVQSWSNVVYALADRLAARCDNHAIPVINRVDRLSNAGKSVCSRLIGSAGIRTPRTEHVDGPEQFEDSQLRVGFPLFVRENWVHGGRFCRADTPEEARAIDLSQFKRPVVVELIDVRSSDGLYRKFRYVAAGDHGVTHHLQIKDDWITKGRGQAFSDSLRDEDLAYISNPDPNHERLQQARRALGLDFVAFDYGYDLDGQLVVWEANPYPLIHYPKNQRRRYRDAAINRTIAAIVKLYLDRAGIRSPTKIDDVLAGGQRTSRR